MPYFRRLRLWSQPLQNDYSIEDCDYDHSPHKNTLFFRTAIMTAILTKWSHPYLWDPHKMITVIIQRTAIMIAILTKYTIYEDCDHNSSPHKNIIFLSLYRITTLIIVLFIRTVIMIAVFTKMSYIWVFMRTATMITVLTKCLIWVFCEDCDHGHTMITVLIKCPISKSVFTENCDHKSQSSYQHHHHQQQSPVHCHRLISNAFHI